MGARGEISESLQASLGSRQAYIKPQSKAHSREASGTEKKTENLVVPERENQRT